MLDEKSLRKPEFTEVSEWITLSDGGRWAFPKPWVILYPTVTGDRVEAMNSETSFGPEFDRLVTTTEATENDREFLKAVSAVAVNLLQRNYALEPEHFRLLLRFRLDGSEESMELIRAIMNTARGLDAPKNFPVGVASTP